jgi:hypothetical protein
MNKYVLILPLAALSFFLGYFTSSPKMEHIYIATVTTVLVATAGLLLLLKHKKEDNSKREKKRFQQQHLL